MSINIVTVADSIAALSVTGVTIKDLDEMPVEVNNRDCPLVIPAPDFVRAVGIERQTFGTGTDVYWNFNYVLNYRMLYMPVGLERGLKHVYPDMIAKTFAFVDAIIEDDTLSGAVDAEFGGMSGIGLLEDPAGNRFWGCEVQIKILEFVNG